MLGGASSMMKVMEMQLKLTMRLAEMEAERQMARIENDHKAELARIAAEEEARRPPEPRKILASKRRAG